MYDWLERTDSARNRVLRVFRGVGKSTALGVRNAWKFRQSPGHQLLVQGADDDLTDDISRDTVAILRGNPLTDGLLREPAGIRHWWTKQGYELTARTPQLRARGILSRVTGNRADEIQNDDVEVLKNVETQEARHKLRKRLSEQSFILKPRGSKLWVGTPHTHESLYDELVAAGAEVLNIPLFAHQTRHKPASEPHHVLPFTGTPGADGVWVFQGIGAPAKLLEEGKDYRVQGNTIVLTQPTKSLIDICLGNAWPERFDRAEMLERRKECATLNYWDQQYQLESKPMNDSRLDPSRITPYDAEPVVRYANGGASMWLGQACIVGAAARWDPSGGKKHSDVSSFAIILQDDTGRRYLHRCAALTGEVAEFEDDGKTIKGGQVWQLTALVKEFNLPRVTVETNGIGGFAPAILRAALKQRGLFDCAVVESNSRTNKQLRILSSFEPLLLTAGQLWAHVDVLIERDPETGKAKHGPFWVQMREWNPALTNQPDDYLDSAAGAIEETPERIRPAKNGIPRTDGRDDWRQMTGVVEVEFER